MEHLSLRVTALLSLCATTTERLTPRDNAVAASRDNNRASVTLCNNAVVASRDNNPATPTHLDVLAQPLSGHTTPTPLLVKHLSLRVTTLLWLRATTRRLPLHMLLLFFLDFVFLGGRAHADCGVYGCGKDVAGKVFPCS